MAKAAPSSYKSASRRTLVWAKSLILRNFGFKILSLAIAILLWGMVREEQDLEQMVDVYLRLERPDDMILLEQVPQYVTVRVNGPRSRLRLAEQQKLEMVLDLKGITPGETTINTASLKIRNLPKDLRVAAYYPSALTLEVDQKGQKEVQLVAQIAGKPAKDFLLTSATIEPSTIVLEGAKAHLEQLDQITTQVVDISGLSRNQERSVDLDYGDYYVWPQSKLMAVQIKIEVKADIIEREVEGIPVLSMDDGQGPFVFEPSNLSFKVSGPRTQVEALRKEHLRAWFDAGERALTDSSFPLRVRWDPSQENVKYPHLNLTVAPPKYSGVKIQVSEPRVVLVNIPAPEPTAIPTTTPDE